MMTFDPRLAWVRTIADTMGIPGYEVTDDNGLLIVDVPGVQDVGRIAAEFSDGILLATARELSVTLDRPYAAVFVAAWPADVMVPAQRGRA